MGHLLLIQMQLFLLKKLKAASGRKKPSTTYYNAFWTFCASSPTTTHFERFVLHHLLQHILNLLCFTISFGLQARHHVRKPTH